MRGQSVHYHPKQICRGGLRFHKTVEALHARDWVFYKGSQLKSERPWSFRRRVDPRDLMRPFPSEPMRMWPISTRVNKPENDDPSIVEPIELSAAQGGCARQLR